MTRAEFMQRRNEFYADMTGQGTEGHSAVLAFASLDQQERVAQRRAAMRVDYRRLQEISVMAGPTTADLAEASTIFARHGH